MNYPNVLVVSHNCFSDSGSNGRTLANFFEGYPIQKLAQLYIYNENPIVSTCDNYYRVTDMDAVKSVFSSQYGGIIKREQAHQERKPDDPHHSIKKTPLICCVRELVWNIGRWNNKRLWKWIDDFNPEVILFQAGDAAFLFNFVRKLAQKRDIPLVIYNSEGYYFKEFDYFRSSGIHKLMYPVFHRQFCRAFRKCIKMAKMSIYCCEKLKTDYDAEFGLPSEVIPTVTQVQPGDKTADNDNLQIVYMGNLGVGRQEGLVEIGCVLQRINPSLKLQVYGKIPNTIVQKAFDDCPGIEYKGFVSYEQVVQIMYSSDILVHTESFTDFYREDLKYAFSTKIADCLASGRCFMLYAPAGMACTEYLRNYDAAHVVETAGELQNVLTHLCSNKDLREKKLENARALVLEKHNPQINTRRFQEILCECVKDVY